MIDLKTSSIILENIISVDLDQYLKHLIDNKDWIKEFEGEKDKDYYTLSYQKNLIEGKRKLFEEDREYRFVIIHRETSEIIGVIALSNIVRGVFQSCFLGYGLSQKNLNKGFMTEAVGLITKFAFEKLNLHRIEANVMPRNKASIRVLEKNGYISEGISKKYLKINGIWEDHVHMVILNEK